MLLLRSVLEGPTVHTQNNLLLRLHALQRTRLEVRLPAWIHLNELSEDLTIDAFDSSIFYPGSR